LGKDFVPEEKERADFAPKTTRINAWRGEEQEEKTRNKKQ
jgi:hypothetical protein